MDTLSENIFVDFCDHLGYRTEKIPTQSDDGLKTPDFRVISGDRSLVAEVKEITPNEEDRKHIEAFQNDEIRVHSSKPGERARREIKSAAKQLREHSGRGYPLIVVLYENFEIEGPNPFYPMFYTMPYNIDFAMFGMIAVTVSLEDRSKRYPDKSGPGKTTNEKEKKYISAVCVISNHDDKTFFVYHNPFAEVPLSTDWFSGEHCIHYKKPEPVYGSPQKWIKI
jgi:hypothetical protein